MSRIRKLFQNRRTRRVVISCILVGVVVGGIQARVYYTNRPDYLWTKARAAFEAGNLEESEIRLQQLLAKVPEHIGARRALVDVYQNMREDADSETRRSLNERILEQLSEVAPHLPDNLRVQEQLFESQLANDRTEDASETANRLVRLGTANPKALFQVARDRFAAERYEAARDVLDRLFSLSASHPLNHSLLLLHVLDKLGDRGRLTDMVDNALANLVRLDNSKAESLADQDYELLNRFLLSSLQFSPNTTIAHRRLGQALILLEQRNRLLTEETERHAVARHAAQLVALIDQRFPVPTSADQSLTEQFRKNGKRFLSLVNPVVEVPGADPLVYLMAARIANRQQDQLTGVAILRQGLTTQTADAEQRQQLMALHLEMGQQLLEQRRFTEAAEEAQQLLAHPDTRSVGHLLAGRIAMAEGRLEDAERYFLATRDELGDTIAIRTVLASLYLQMGRWLDARLTVESLQTEWETLSEDELEWIQQHLGGREALWLAQIAAHLNMDEPEQARQVIRNLRGTDTEPAALRMLAVYRWQQGEVETARDILRTAIDRFPHRLDLLVTYTTLLDRLNNPEEARILLSGFAARHADQIAPQLALARRLASAGDTKAALERLEQVHRRFPNNASAALLTAEILVSARQTDLARVWVKKLSEFPELEAAVTLLDVRLTMLERGLEAVADQFSQIDPELRQLGVFQILKAEISRQHGNWQEAIDAYARSMPFSRLRSHAGLGLLAVISRLSGDADLEGLQTEVNRLLEQHPREPLIVLAAAEIAARRKQIPVALELLDRLAELWPMNVWPRIAKARLLRADERHQAALESLLQSIQSDPENVTLRVAAVELFREMKQPENGYPHIDHVLESQPANHQLQLLKVQLMIDEERLQDAADELDRLTRIHPEHEPYYLSLAALYEKMERPESAAGVLKRAGTQIALSPRIISGHIRLLCQLEQWQAAHRLAAMFAGRERKPEDCFLLSQAFRAGGWAAAARQWIDLGLGHAEIAPERKRQGLLLSANLHLSEGLKNNNADELKAAADQFRAILDEQPDNLLVLNNLAWLEAEKLNHPQAASDLVDRILELATPEQLSPRVLDTVVTAMRKANRHEEASQLVRDGLSRFPESALLHMQSGLLLVETSADIPAQLEQARKELERALELGLDESRASEVQQLLTQQSEAATE